METSYKESFSTVELNWDLERLYRDLALVKGKRLSPAERRYLRGLLCGYSPSELAHELHKSTRGLEAFLSHTLYQYVKGLTGNQKMRNYRDISDWLEDLNYKKSQKTSYPQQKSQADHLSPIKNINVEMAHIVNVENFHFDFEKNTIKFDIHIHFEGGLPEKEKPEKDDG